MYRCELRIKSKLYYRQQFKRLLAIGSNFWRSIAIYSTWSSLDSTDPLIFFLFLFPVKLLLDFMKGTCAFPQDKGGVFAMVIHLL